MIDKKLAMLTIDRLYSLNAFISARYIGQKHQPTPDEIITLNLEIGRIIKDLREIIKE